MSDSPESILADCWQRLQAGRAHADHPFRTAALATADALGRPDVRTIVLRHVDPNTRTLDFQTDRRSPKFHTLHHNASAAWLFYDAGEKLQLRIQTTAVPHTHDEMVDAAWAAAPDSAKQPYCSEVPSSDPIDSPTAPAGQVENGRVNFAVVRCLVESLEWLKLGKRAVASVTLCLAQRGSEMAVVSAVSLLPAVRPQPAAGPSFTLVNETPLWDRSRIAWLLHTTAVLALSLCLWALCLNLYRQNNTFPSTYHPDETGKGAQIADNDRNFNHPQLMLEGALLLLPPQPKPATSPTFNAQFQPPPFGGDVQRIVEHGRNTSAAFGAGAAVLFAWAGFAAAGWIGFLGVGLAVGLCPALLSHSHYFKEDPALVFGVAATLCAGAWAIRVRFLGAKVWTLIALGIGAGLAASGKYCGAVMLIPAVLMSLIATRRSLTLLPAAPLIVLAFAGVTWAGVNYRIFSDFEHFVQNFTKEADHGTSEHGDLTMNKPNGFFPDIVWQEAMPHVKLLAIAAVPALVWHAWQRRRFAFGMMLMATIAIYLTMLAYSVIPFYRYAVPATVMLYALAGLSVAWLVTIPKTLWKQLAVAAVCLLTIGLSQYYRCLDYNNQFANDSRDQLREWIASPAGLPAGANYLCDTYAVPFARNSQANFNGAPGNDEDTPDKLRQRGIKYVITCSSSCDRYLTPYTKAAYGNGRDVEALKSLYRELQDNPQKYPVVWERVARHPMRMFANPDIRVYRLDGPA